MRLLQQPVIKFLVIPLVLLGVWTFGSLFLNTYESFTSITYPNYHTVNYRNTLLEKNTVIQGNFVANENNLGTILLTFSVIPHQDYDHQDILLFRLKEQGQKEWYSQNKYHSGIFEDSPTFPFGFLPITDSKDHTYMFELESLSGNSDNAVTAKDTFAVRYMYDKAALHNPRSLISFVIKKLYISVFDINFLLGSFIYIAPFLIYLLWLILSSKQSIKLFDPIIQRLLKHNHTTHVFNTFIKERRWMLLVIFFIVVTYSLITTRANMGISIFIIAWWIVMIVGKIVNSKISFIFFVILVTLGFLGIIFSQINFSTRISSWGYIFLLIGAIQAVMEEKAAK